MWCSLQGSEDTEPVCRGLLRPWRRIGRNTRSYLHGCDGIRHGLLLPPDDIPGLQYWGSSAVVWSANPALPNTGWSGPLIDLHKSETSHCLNFTCLWRSIWPWSLVMISNVVLWTFDNEPRFVVNHIIGNLIWIEKRKVITWSWTGCSIQVACETGVSL